MFISIYFYIKYSQMFISIYFYLKRFATGDGICLLITLKNFKKNYAEELLTIYIFFNIDSHLIP